MICFLWTTWLPRSWIKNTMAFLWFKNAFKHKTISWTCQRNYETTTMYVTFLYWVLIRELKDAHLYRPSLIEIDGKKQAEIKEIFYSIFCWVTGPAHRVDGRSSKRFRTYTYMYRTKKVVTAMRDLRPVVQPRHNKGKRARSLIRRSVNNTIEGW